jgi:hypothetical protein
MQKVIGGRRFDTAAAEEVCASDNGLNRGDFKYRAETLYRTRSGRWFVHHEGGAMSDVAVASSGGYTNGEDIEPVSDEEAFRFLEARSADREARAALDKYFGDRLQIA